MDGTKPVAFCGIDPGNKGAICALIPSTKQAAFISTSAKPYDILDWFYKLEQECFIAVVMIEDVHSIFGTSAKSNFNFGYNVGLINGLALATNNTMDRVPPKKWQKFIGIKSKGKAIKNEVAEICERLYPQVNIRGPKGGLQDGMSDALMIAHYASQTFKII